MGKYFPAVILALALCVGLAVPAFAADAAQPPMPEVTFDLPDGSTAAEKTDTYQILHITDGKTEDGKDAFVYAGEPSSETLTATPLPFGVSVAIGHIARLANRATCSVTLNACSDPDGDGIYQERIFFWQPNTAYGTTDYDLIPLTAKGPFAAPGMGACGYVTDVNINHTSTVLNDFVGFRFEGGYDGPEYALTATSDALYQLFGPNTLLRITAQWDGGEPEELACLLLTGEGTPAPSFTDVPAGQWYADPVAWAVDKGITNGTTPTTFSPGQDCTEIQILTFLWRAEDKPASTATVFSDLAGDYAPAANWAYEQGMIDDSFDPSAPCTRSTAVSYIWQALGEPEAEASSFTDVPAGASYAKAVDWAVEKGVTKGDGSEDTFAPDKVCTRGHIVTFLQRAYNG